MADRCFRAAADVRVLFEAQRYLAAAPFRRHVLGFSEGAVTAYLLVASHPQLFNKLVAIGGPLGSYDPPLSIIESEPLIREMEQMYRAPFYVRQEEVQSIALPALVMAGDRDQYNSLPGIVETFHLFPKGELALIPGCGHVVLDCKVNLVIGIVKGFLDSEK